MKNFMPKEVDDVDMAFGPISVYDYLPAMKDIPEEFQRHGATKWHKIVSDWFFAGLKDSKFYPKDGIDPEAAYKHIACILGSWEPKHEHKEYGCAWLLSLWFEKVEYEIERNT